MAKAHLQSFQVPLSSCLYLFGQGLQNIAVVQKNDFFFKLFFLLHITYFINLVLVELEHL